MTTSKFNHLFSVGFTITCDEVDGIKIPSSELIKALKDRIVSLEAMTNEDEILGDFTLCDTFEMESL